MNYLVKILHKATIFKKSIIGKIQEAPEGCKLHKYMEKGKQFNLHNIAFSLKSKMTLGQRMSKASRKLIHKKKHVQRSKAKVNKTCK